MIRINSQSGKGGVSFILEQNYGYRLPAKMKEDLGYYIKGISDHDHREIKPNEIHDLFMKEYVNRSDTLELLEVHFTQENGFGTKLSLMRGGIIKNYTGHGKGRLDAVSNSIKRHCNVQYKIICYEEHAMAHGSDAQAAAYVGIQDEQGNVFWGAGTEDDIINASVLALLSAVNRMGVK